MVSGFADCVPTPLDTLVEYICMTRSEVGSKILGDIVGKVPMVVDAQELLVICRKYLPSLPKRSQKEVAKIARLHVMRDLEFHHKVNAIMYKYAAYAKYRALLVEIADMERFVFDAQELLKDGGLETTHRFCIDNVIDDMREMIESKKKAVIVFAEMSVVVSDVMVALDDVRNDSLKWESFTRMVDRFGKVYAARTCKLPMYRNDRVLSYISAVHRKKQNGVMV